MPVMSGLECVSQLRIWEKVNSKSKQKILCVTGSDIENEKILEAGMDGVVKKPINKNSLKNALMLIFQNKIGK